MVKNALLKETIRTIKKEFKRFISLVCIIALGCGFFIGMKCSTPVLKNTLASYTNRTNLMDIKIISDIGLTKSELEELKKRVPGILVTEAAYYKDVIVDYYDSQKVLRVNSYNEKNSINKLELIEGHLPNDIHECVIQSSMLGAGYRIGDNIILNDSIFNDQDVTIVGVVTSPLYISNDIGRTNLLSGKVNYYIYVHSDNFNYDYYTLGYLKLDTNLNIFDQKYKNLISDKKEEIKVIAKEISNKRLQSIIDDNEKIINEMQTKYDEEYSKALKEYNDALDKINNAQEKIDNGYSQLLTEEDISNYLAEAKSKLDEYKTQLDTAKKQIDILKEQYDSLIVSGDITLSLKKTALETKIEIYNKQIKTLKEEIASEKKELENTTLKLRIKVLQASIARKEKNLLDYEQALETAINELSVINNQLNKSDGTYPQYITNAENQYNALASEYESKYNQYINAKSELENNNNKAKEELDSNQNLLNEKRKELEEEKNKILKEFDEKQKEIDDAREVVASLKNSKWNIFSLFDNSGYSQYNDDIDSVSNLSKIFPIIFFLVAALITLTSISRMVEEERTQIGTLKALGYKNKEIIIKYILYSSFATLIGFVIGSVIGFTIIPMAIYKVYSLMYKLPPIKLSFNIIYAILGLVFSLLSTTLTAYIVSKKVLKENPTLLMRPAAPKVCKKTLIERITFIWNHIKFNNKITIRNLFMYKKRLIMTIVGVAGCTALIISGLNIRSSIADIIPTQYGKIFDVDVQLFFKNDIEKNVIQNEYERIKNLSNTKYVALSHYELVDVKSEYKTYSVSLISFDDTTEAKSIINLFDYKTKEPLTITQGGVIISSKLAQLLNVNINDSITFSDINGEEYTVTIDEICENYTDHYIYISKEEYFKIYSFNSRNNMLLLKCKTTQDDTLLSKELNVNNNFSSMLFVSSSKQAYNEILNNLNSIIMIIIISAGLLAVVVLYNLSSINLTERRREIATIKVLGFRKTEVKKYIGKETLILIFVSIIIGCVLGYYLTDIIITTCEIDKMMFIRKFNITNYILSIIITILFSSIVNTITNREIKKIDMIESLKSIE